MFKNLSIKYKLTLMNVGTSSIALLLACLAFVAYDITSFKTSRATDFTISAQMIGDLNTAALLFDNAGDAEQSLAILRNEQSIIAACIYVFSAEDNTSRVFARFLSPGASGTL